MNAMLIRMKRRRRLGVFLIVTSMAARAFAPIADINNVKMPASGQSGAVQVAVPSVQTEPREVRDRRELFVDSFLIDSMYGARLVLHEPHDEGVALRFDQPWEGPFCGYSTVIRDGDRYRLYYRGLRQADGGVEVTCVAESDDGVNWTKPTLGLVEFAGSRSNNIILASTGLSHNFSPFLDSNPAIRPGQQYKAIAGGDSGLYAVTSPDGIHWAKLRAQPILSKEHLPGDLLKRDGWPQGFDSQNVAFWSQAEQRYLLYYRVNVRNGDDFFRRIGRAESQDFVHWTHLVLMEYRGADGTPAPLEHLYTSQTHPYFRAPHIYIALAARFMPGRKVLIDEEAKAIGVHPSYFRDASDAVIMTSRGGNVFDRTFLSSIIRPGIGPRNWVSRNTYPALNVVQTGPTEMSIYVNQDYAQPTAHLRRYSLRLDGFASVRVPYEGGELVTRPLLFQGARLYINFSTSAAGSVRVEIQNAQGQPIPGFTLADSSELIGNEIEREVRWMGNPNLAALAGQPIRLRFVMKDADLYALRFLETGQINSANPNKN